MCSFTDHQQDWSRLPQLVRLFSSLTEIYPVDNLSGLSFLPLEATVLPHCQKTSLHVVWDKY